MNRKLMTLLVVLLTMAGTASALTGTDGIYQFDDSVPFGWVDATGGTQLVWVGGDDEFQNVNIPFPFTFYGAPYNQIQVAINGLNLPGAVGTTQFGNQPIGASTPDNFIAPWWDDLTVAPFTGSQGRIYYQTLGSAPNRQFVVEWVDTTHFNLFPLSDGVTFEAIIYEGSNNILFQYRDTSFGNAAVDNGNSATVGIESPSGSGLQYSFDQPVLRSGLAILFEPVRRGVVPEFPSIALPVGAALGLLFLFGRRKN